MKPIFLASFCGLLSLITPRESFGQNLTPSPMGSSIKSSSRIESMKPLEKPKPGETSKTSSNLNLPFPVKSPTLRSLQAKYFHPGILVFRRGEWEGSDHLLNVSKNIGVYVSVLKPEKEPLAITDDQIKKQVESIFEKVRIKPQILVGEGEPPLPFFELEILIYPVARGYVACCDGRLFESVTLKRFNLDPDMAFQAITWEKRTLIVGPKTRFLDQLNETVQDIANAFAERFEVYEKLKEELTY